MLKASVKEVARRAEVSVGTVSNVLNRPDLVAPATKERVMAAIEELGYVRNEAARHLRAGQSRTVGLVVLDVANPFFTDVARGAEDLADEYGAMVVVCNSGESPEREVRHIAQLEEQRVLGILITPASTQDVHLERIVERGTPVVLVDREAGVNRCSVAVDDELGGRLAGTHLADNGHRHVGFVGGPFTIKQVSDRHAGLVAATGDDAVITLITGKSLSVAEGRSAGKGVAALPDAQRPTAVFCANDLLALGFLQEMTRQRIRVPDDIAIVGYDDIGFAAAAAVPLSSVRQPREQLGRAAMDLLLDEVRYKASHNHRQVVFEPDLIVRESSTIRR